MTGVLAHPEKLIGAALNLFFPQYCIGCGREGDFLCQACRESLPRLEPPLCFRCGRPWAQGTLCTTCQDWQADIDAIRSPFRFEGVVREAIHQLKYNNIRALAGTLSHLLRDYLVPNRMESEIIVPVPLHPKRLRERGYNQSALLANELGKLTGIPVIEHSLVRNKHTPPQTRTASVVERRNNIAGAFICRGKELKGKNVLLIDDVATSGATLNAGAAALKETGTGTVWGLTVAREI